MEKINNQTGDENFLDDVPRSILLILATIIGGFLTGGFFAGSETAFSFCNPIRMKVLADDGDRSAERVLRLLEKQDAVIVSLLIYINIIYVTTSVIVTSLFVSITGSDAKGSLFATVIVTVSLFLFSDTIPKNIARANSDKWILKVSLILTVSIWLLTPVLWFFLAIGRISKKIFSAAKDNEPSVTEDEFATIVEGVEDDGLIEPDETKIIKSAIEFGDILARDAMTPKERIVAIAADADVEEVKRILLKEKYSRFPVYFGTIDNTIGILQSANCLWKLAKGQPFSIKDNITKPYVVRQDTHLREVFEGMGGRHTHFAVVESEEGKTLGILTMEDILEEIVGEIYDEDDKEVPEDDGKTEGRE